MKGLRGFSIYFAGFVVLSALYAVWMTGGSFSFTEVAVWPNYNSLAKAFLNGRLFLENPGLEDYVSFDGKAYMYQGPAPALLRLPVMLVFGIGISTGLMVVLFCAGVAVLFALVLNELHIDETPFFRSPLKIVFTVTMVFCGFSLLMVTVPSFHHEAIAAAMFFLMASVYLILRIRNKDFHLTTVEAVFLGVSFAMCIGSRSSYVIAVGLLGLWLLVGWWKSSRGNLSFARFRGIGIVIIIGLVTVLGLLAYNKARFGSLFDFGMNHQASIVFQDYFNQGNYFRYDHLPYNLWHMFFRLPEVTRAFPYLMLPGFVLKVESVALHPYVLINSNELSVSIFCLMPVTLLAFCPLFKYLRNKEAHNNVIYFVLFGVWACQVLLPCFTVAATARYYYDSLPILLVLSFIGAVWLKSKREHLQYIAVGLAVVSIIISFSLPMNGLLFYGQYVPYKAPLVPLFFGP